MKRTEDLVSKTTFLLDDIFEFERQFYRLKVVQLSDKEEAESRLI